MGLVGVPRERGGLLCDPLTFATSFPRLLCGPHGRLRGCPGLPGDLEPFGPESHGLHQEGQWVWVVFSRNEGLRAH